MVLTLHDGLGVSLRTDVVRVRRAAAGPPGHLLPTPAGEEKVRAVPCLSLTVCHLRRKQERLAASETGYPQPKPDPVLWFPGGDAECGTNAGSESSSKLWEMTDKYFQQTTTLAHSAL